MILTFDIGGSRIRAATWDGQRLLPLGRGGDPCARPHGVSSDRRGICRGQGLPGLAISIAGVVDPATGLGKVANIPAIDGLALGPALQGATGLPVLVLNDADCFTLAEARLGAGRGLNTVFGVILGSGVGGGLVVGGKVVAGAGSYAGEWGHGSVLRGAHAFACGCGQVGCLDTIGGARGIERLHQALTGKVLTSNDIITRWQEGDQGAAATMSLWRDLMAGPLAMVLNVVGADIVPVGGGLGQAPGVLGYLDETVRRNVLRQTDAPLLVPALTGPDAALYGAALAGMVAWS